MTFSEDDDTITLVDVETGTETTATREQIADLLGIGDDDPEGQSILSDFFGFAQD